MKIKKNGLLSLLLCLSLVFVMAISPTISYAADEETLIENNLVVYEERTDVASYRGETKTAPTKENFVFAGWYEKVGEDYEPMTAAEADNATSAYAKFVDAKVHGVKFQLSANTTTSSETTDLRMVTAVDSLNYINVGFGIAIGELSTSRTSNVVYESITGFTDEGAQTYTPSGAFGTDVAAYFMSYQITGVTNEYFGTDFTVTTFWTTLDGTIVKNAQPRVFSVNEFAIVGIDGAYSGLCDYPLSGKAGDTLSFDVIAPEGAGYNFWLLLDGAWESGKQFQYDWQTPHVELTIERDFEFIRFQTGGAGVQLVFENIDVTTPVAIDGIYPGSSDYAITGTAGQVLSFDIDAPEGAGYNFWLLLNGQWGAGFEHQLTYTGDQHVEMVLGTDITSVTFQTAGAGVQLVFDNIEVKNPPVAIDGIYPGSYSYAITGTAGQVLSFDIDAPEGAGYNFWLLLNGQWGAGFEHQLTYTGDQHVEMVLGTDITSVTFQTAGAGVQLVFDNIEVKNPPVAIDGIYPGSYSYAITGTAGQVLSFDIDAPEGAGYNFWVLLNGQWGAGFEHQLAYTGDQHVEMVLGTDITSVTFQTAGAGVQLVFDNIEVTTPVAIDGNYPGSYSYAITGAAGQTLSFDVVAPEGAGYNFWLLLNGNWGAGSEFRFDWQTPHVELVLGTDITSVTFQTGGSGVQLGFKNIQVQ